MRSTDDQASHQMVRWIHVTDLQLGFGKSADNDNDTNARRLIEQVVSEEADFVINSGDLIHGAHADQTLETIAEYWSDYQATVKPLEGKSPILSAPGNHDMTREDRSMERYCLETGRAGPAAVLRSDDSRRACRMSRCRFSPAPGRFSQGI